MSLNVDLLAIEALTLGGLAVALHASSHRYGLAPLLVFITGLVAVLHAMGANPILIDAWGTRLVVTDSVIVPVTLASVLMLYDVQGTAVELGGELSGPELAKAVIDRHPSLPLVFTSGYSVDAPPDFMELSRHIPLLKKPFHRTELASLVGESLGQKPVPSSAT